MTPFADRGEALAARLRADAVQYRARGAERLAQVAEAQAEDVEAMVRIDRQATAARRAAGMEER